MTPERQRECIQDWIQEGIQKFLFAAKSDPKLVVAAVFATHKDGKELEEPETVLVDTKPFPDTILQAIDEYSAIATFVACTQDNGEVNICVEAKTADYGRSFTGRFADDLPGIIEFAIHLETNEIPLKLFAPKVWN